LSCPRAAPHFASAGNRRRLSGTCTLFRDAAGPNRFCDWALAHHPSGVVHRWFFCATGRYIIGARFAPSRTTLNFATRSGPTRILEFTSEFDLRDQRDSQRPFATFVVARQYSIFKELDRSPEPSVRTELAAGTNWVPTRFRRLRISLPADQNNKARTTKPKQKRHDNNYTTWWAWVDSNYRPHPYQGCALAT
jgi:hypothetical protein